MGTAFTKEAHAGLFSIELVWGYCEQKVQALNWLRVHELCLPQTVGFNKKSSQTIRTLLAPHGCTRAASFQGLLVKKEECYGMGDSIRVLAVCSVLPAPTSA